MDMALVIGISQPDLGRAMARAPGIEPMPCSIRSFPDEEPDVSLNQPVHLTAVPLLAEAHAARLPIGVVHKRP
jgi:phosphoribosylpyrophosphate synthetase